MGLSHFRQGVWSAQSAVGLGQQDPLRDWVWEWEEAGWHSWVGVPGWGKVGRDRLETRGVSGFCCGHVE